MNTDYTSIFIDHIREHVLRYFPGLIGDEIEVQLRSRQERSSATLYRFHVKDNSHVYSIIVKVSARNLLKGRLNDLGFEKPLLFPKAEETEMHSLQYTALITIYEYFTGLNRKQFGVIRVLDYLPQFQAVFMEESSDPKLRQLFFRENRFYSPFTPHKLVPVFRNVGTWLHLYHAIPKREQAQVRHEHREDYIEGVANLTDFLASRLGDRSFFNQIALILTAKASERLPATLPLGLGHGDYAMRNILVGPNSRVTVLDTFARWRTPIYEDVGYFLTELKMTYPQVISQGLLFSRGRLNVYEDAFLKGYFDQKDIPYPAIRLYEILALLDKWCSILILSYRRTGRRKLAGRALAALASLYFKRSIKHLLREITTTKVGASSLDLERSY